ncbi:MAG: CbrC family protein [Thermoleophilaceae bacterium]|nr:CbrC family protein [Thermoleophilaceae bacterium]
MSDPAELPIFKYYPDPVAGGSVEASDAACAGCKRRRGFISPSLLYAEKVPDDARFCPWCIADGSATALLAAPSTNSLRERRMTRATR